MTIKTVILGEPTVDASPSNPGFTRWSAPLEGLEGLDSIWYEVPDEYAHAFSDRVDGAVIALATPLQRIQKKLIVKGAVSDQLAFKFPEVQDLLQNIGQGEPTQFEFDRVVSTDVKTEGWVISGFSAGIDSYATLAEHLFSVQHPVPAEYKITHFVFNNVGSHGHYGEALWRQRMERANNTAKEMGVPMIAVNSNISFIPSNNADYRLLNSLANASVPHILGAKVKRWVFSSSIEYARVRVDSSIHNSAFVDPISLPLLSTSSVNLQVASSRFRRIDKVKLVAEIPYSYTSLDVCTRNALPGRPTNCSVCWKCRVTMGALDLIGKLDLYKKQFDLDRWFEDRDVYFAKAQLPKQTAFVQELCEMMDEVGYEVSQQQKLSAYKDLKKQEVKKQLGKVRRLAGKTVRKIKG